MSEEANRIVFPSNIVWERPLCSTVSGCYCWDDSSPTFRCFAQGCSKEVKVKYKIYTRETSPRLKPICDDLYNNRRFYAVLDCKCQAPVCDNCSRRYAWRTCRICGQNADIEIVFKRNIMSEKNTTREPCRAYWLMKLTDAETFKNENLGLHYPKFLEWFLARGRVIDFTEMNSDAMCEHVTQFKLFCYEEFMIKNLGTNPPKFLDWYRSKGGVTKGGIIDVTQMNPDAMYKYVIDFKNLYLTLFFMRSTSAVMRRIARSMRIFNSQFERFMIQSVRFDIPLQLINFHKNDLKRYCLFGFVMKMIEKLAQPSIVFQGRNQIPHYFWRLYSRILNL